MAFRDWNNDGKIDSQDSFIDYQIYQNCTKNNNTASGSNHCGGISIFGAILSVIAGLVLQANASRNRVFSYEEYLSILRKDTNP